MSEGETKLSISLPGEWALQKVLGPTLDELGLDLKNVYRKGMDRIVKKAVQKLPEPSDGKIANLRVAHDVLTNGVFSEDEVCTEYFSGVLASSRSEDGKDDSSIQYVSAIKTLSAKQLRLHYTIYNTLNKMLAQDTTPINVAQSSELNSRQLWFSTAELESSLGLQLDTDLNILHRQGLLAEYQTGYEPVTETKSLPFTKAVPTTFGVLLYASAHNRIKDWRSYSQIEFGDFENINLPKYWSHSLGSFLDLLRSQKLIPESDQDDTLPE